MSLLTASLVQAGFMGVLDDESVSLTLFAPTDDAFGTSVPVDLLAKLSTDAYGLHLTELLSTHVVNGEYMTAALIDGLELPTGSVFGETLLVDRPSGDDIALVTSAARDEDFANITIAPTNVIEPDVDASNGVVQVVDSVLLPEFVYRDLFEALEAAGMFTSITTALTTAGLEDDLRGEADATILAPTDAAFAALSPEDLAFLMDPNNIDLLTQTVLNHVLTDQVFNYQLYGNQTVELDSAADSGTVAAYVGLDGGVPILPTFEGVTVSGYYLSNNGIIYALDAVLPLEDAASPTASPVGGGAQTPPPTTSPVTNGGLRSMLEIIASEDRFSTLNSVLQVTPVVVDIVTSSNNRLTVFAPNDAAFAAIPDELRANLLNPAYELHREAILLYHITQGQEFLDADLVNGFQLPTFEPLTPITVERNASGAYLDTATFGNGVEDMPAQIVDFDILAREGVMHEIDRVLLPTTALFDVYDYITQNVTDYASLLALVALTDLEGLLRQGDVTILAPTNAAIMSLSEATVNFLTDPVNNEALRSVLLYHVIPQVIDVTILQDGDTFTTLQGGTVTFDASLGASGGFVGTYGSGEITAANVLVLNGVVNNIDGVLSPIELP